MSEQLFELGRRTFDTPHFRGIEFIEVEAKTVVNPVRGNYLPFNWTLNPYRGCSHACTYCAVGETPVLMADGRTKALGEIRKGDLVLGTRTDGRYRRYTVTEVLDHWRTVKRAYRVTLSDGTSLVTSGDHRFLTNSRGWKHVIGSMTGPLQRPYLTTNNELVGTGRFAESPKDSPEYRRGYLCGLIRGGANLGSYEARRSNGNHYTAHRFRLALADREALDRASSYLADEGLSCGRFLFEPASARTRRIEALRLQSRSGVAAIRSIIEWPGAPTPDWCKGFLAGIFDAEGSRSQHVLRIVNTDLAILDAIRAALKEFDFHYVEEWRTTDSGRPIASIRIRGGLSEHLRFFHLTNPAISRKMAIEGKALKASIKLKVESIEDLRVELPMYDITTGTGDFIMNGVVSHNCFARPTHTFMDMGAGKDFESKIVVKVNTPEVLAKDLRSKRWKGESIAMGTATDPYQRAEGRYKLMPRIIETLTSFRNPFSILTKGTLILRDLDLLAEARCVMEVSTAFSIGTLDEEVWRRSEPGTPHPRKRMDAVAKLNEAGVPCGILMAPILPGISDSPHQMKEVVRAAVDAGATSLSPIVLHLRPGVKEVFMPWLEDNYPELVGGYSERYARSAYVGKVTEGTVRATVQEMVTDAGGLKRQHPHRGPRARGDGSRHDHLESIEQLSLL